MDLGTVKRLPVNCSICGAITNCYKLLCSDHIHEDDRIRKLSEYNDLLMEEGKRWDAGIQQMNNSILSDDVVRSISSRDISSVSTVAKDCDITKTAASNILNCLVDMKIIYKRPSRSRGMTFHVNQETIVTNGQT